MTPKQTTTLNHDAWWSSRIWQLLELTNEELFDTSAMELSYVECHVATA